jgi:hypothetical protein
MEYYNSVLEAKSFLMRNGFEISANVYGEIEYLNKYGQKITMRKYKDGTCSLCTSF